MNIAKSLTLIVVAGGLSLFSSARFGWTHERLSDVELARIAGHDVGTDENDTNCATSSLEGDEVAWRDCNAQEGEDPPPCVFCVGGDYLSTQFPAVDPIDRVQWTGGQIQCNLSDKHVGKCQDNGDCFPLQDTGKKCSGTPKEYRHQPTSGEEPL